MNRYRAFAPPDDDTLQEGDDGFFGVDTYNSAENVQPGLVQEAVNVDFTTQDAQTRGGFVCLPELGATPFGSAWTTRVSSANKPWKGVAYGNDVYVAVNSDTSTNVAMTSPDGTTWTSRVTGVDNQWVAVCFGRGMFVAVAASGTGNRVMTSPDGVTWTARTSAGDYPWTDVCYGNGRFVAVASDGHVMFSPDSAVTWNLGAAANSTTWEGVTFGNDYFVAVGNGGIAPRSMFSADGNAWTAATTVPAQQWKSVAYGNGLFVAVGDSGTGNRVMTSADMLVWVNRTSAADSDWASVTFGGGRFFAVALAATNRVMESFDGITWARRASSTNNDWQAVTSGTTSAGTTFVAVSATGSLDHVMTWATPAVFASAIYSDPDDPGSQWMMLVGATKVGFYAFGRQSRTVDYATGETVSQQSTIVQCNNLVYIFRGSGETPLRWTGDWSADFELAPTPAPLTGFEIIPNSNQATYYQDRLWVKKGKDTVAASDVLDFTAFDELANEFRINTGDSNYVVTTYPFGDNALIVFKNRSIVALQNVEGDLGDVTATEITRQVGAIGINSVVSVGPDVVYMSDRNINLLTLTTTNNAVQHKILPLSSKIQKIFNRVNWQAAPKVSMGYNDNKLYVALPLDNSTVCNAVVVYNFVTEQWFGEWNFSTSLGMAIQGWVVATYLGLQRMHCITEDGRVFVTGEGQNDISGAIVAEISTSLTTRAYKMDNNNRVNRRMWMDLGTNRPDFSVVSYVDGASESSAILTNQTYLRSQSWIFSDAPYDLTNANDDYNRPGRKDYASGPDSVECGSGFLPEMLQEFRLPIITRGKGRLTWFKITNEQGFISINGVGAEARAGDRSSLLQVL